MIHLFYELKNTYIEKISSNTKDCRHFLESLDQKNMYLYLLYSPTTNKPLDNKRVSLIKKYRPHQDTFLYDYTKQEKSDSPQKTLPIKQKP